MGLGLLLTERVTLANDREKASRIMVTLAGMLHEELKRTGNSVIGEGDTAWLLARFPPGLHSWCHLQLVEHMLCEYYKTLHPQGRENACEERTSDYGDLFEHCKQLLERA